MIVNDIRTERGISVYALANAIGLSRTRVAAILAQRGAAWDNVRAIAAVLGVEPEAIAEPAVHQARPLMPYGRWRE